MKQNKRWTKLMLAMGLVFGLLLGAPAYAMNKAELIDAIASDAGLSKADAKRALDGFVNVVGASLKKGDRVALIGFGAFSISKRTVGGFCDEDSDGDGLCDGTCTADGLCVCESPWEPEFQAGDPEFSECQIYSTDKDIIPALARTVKLSEEDAARFLDSFKSVVSRVVRRGQWVEAGGFGNFWLERMPARRGRNPQTGATIQIKAKRVAKFKAGKALADTVK